MTVDIDTDTSSPSGDPARVDLVRDRALVVRAQAGELPAFDELYQRYHERLTRFCFRRLHDPYDAEDAAQETFPRAWRTLPYFAGERRFYPWLTVIASNLCADMLRTRGRTTPWAEIDQRGLVSDERTGEEVAMASADADVADAAFQRLSDRQQRVLHLREGAGWSYQSIAAHEGLGVSAVEGLIFRARQAWKREILRATQAAQ